MGQISILSGGGGGGTFYHQVETDRAKTAQENKDAYFSPT